MGSQEVLDKILDTFPDLPRPSWCPIFKRCDDINQSSIYTSRFGGNQPFRPDNFKWPICDECNAHKAFVCQINLETLPVSLQDSISRSSGLFQLFYCLECMPLDCFKDLIFIDKSELVPSLKSLAANVLVKQTKLDKTCLPRPLLESVEDYTETVPIPEADWRLEPGDELSMNLVTGWRQNLLLDIPQYTELDEEEYRDKIRQRTGLTEEQVTQMYEWLEETSEGRGVTSAAAGVKLGGYVNWCQGVEYPECPDCRVAMVVTFLQLEQDRVYEFMWGDCGTGHVTLCPRCGRPGLSWACS